MYTRQPVVVTDVLTDPLWADYPDLAKISGLRACWSTPILSSKGEVLGSFAMYRQEHAARVPKRRDSLKSPPTLPESQSSGNARRQSCSRSMRNWRSGWRSGRASCAKKTRQMEEELQMARELQVALLPRQFPTIPVGAPPHESALSFLSLYFPPAT
jgi:FOG: GAF domain